MNATHASVQSWLVQLPALGGGGVGGAGGDGGPDGWVKLCPVHFHWFGPGSAMEVKSHLQPDAHAAGATLAHGGCWHEMERLC